MKYFLIFLVMLKICSIAESQSCTPGFTATAIYYDGTNQIDIGMDSTSVRKATAAGYDTSIPTLILATGATFSATDNNNLLTICKQYFNKGYNVLLYRFYTVYSGSPTNTFCEASSQTFGTHIFEQTQRMLTNNGQAHTFTLIGHLKGAYVCSKIAQLLRDKTSPSELAELAYSLDAQVTPGETDAKPFQKGFASRVIVGYTEVGMGTVPNQDNGDVKFSSPAQDITDVFISVNSGQSYNLLGCADGNSQLTGLCLGPNAVLNSQTVSTLSGYYRVVPSTQFK